ncbi:Dihydrogeodin oxidase [Metarhizium brunneum]|uniref:Laccase 1 n=1 Tax=Metarhizium brunneum TaxID=500148 RepID=A0A7D5Z732_9HYPO|nr:Dihydrogeodin oxidase [Metarhizium brunneum]
MALLRRLTQLLALCHGGFASKPKANCSCTNSPQHRDCWRQGFNIHSDPDKVVPKGRLREYELTVTQELIAPDGYLVKGTVFNGQYPGPLIEADWGDTLRITVHNNLTNFNGTGVHWHGIRQSETVWLDGVPGVTQCPSKPGSSQTYEFRAMQYGTSWYHSHFSLQYSNGLYGPLVIHGPSSANWDVDLGPWLLSDWYHDDAFKLYYYEIFTPRAAIPNSMVLNGKGLYDCDPKNDTRCTGKKDFFEVTLERGTKYKIGLTHTGTLLTETFWIDGHNFTVISNDFVAIEPYVTDVINIGIGQRYEIIVEANASLENGPNFWIHAQYCNEPDILDHRVGIVRYDAKNKSDPYTPPRAHLKYGCADPGPNELVPVVPMQVGRRVNNMEPSEYLKIGLQGWPNASDPNSLIHKWVLRHTPMYLDWREPSLKKLALNTGNASLFTPETEPIYLDYETGEWVYFVITSNYTLEGVDPPRTIPQSVHPMHLHGHDLLVLAQGQGPFTEDVVPKLDNPPRRDVANCPIDGYLWIAFRIDNPGAWLMHCHIAWHASDGLSIQFLEQPGKIKGLMEKAGVMPEFSQRCEEWTEWYENNNMVHEAEQDDSGI